MSLLLSVIRLLITQNPTDWKHKASLAPPGSILGCDLSGTIVKTSPSHPHLKEGQAVAAYVHGGKFDDRGAFAEYANVRGDFVIVLPDGAEGKGWGKDGGLEYSSSLGIPFVTASMASLPFLPRYDAQLML